MASARNAVAERDLGELHLSWEIAFDDPSRRIHDAGGDSSGSHPSSSHIHGETTIDGAHVHVDWTSASRTAPGRSIREVRIFINGDLVGEAFRAGCSLGGGGSDWPAVVLLGNLKAIVVDGDVEPIVAYQDTLTLRLRDDAAVQRPVVWLWQIAPRAGRRADATGSGWWRGVREARIQREQPITVEPERYGPEPYGVEDWLDGIEPPPTPPLKLPK
jgi:hypothetical protein